MKEEDLVKAPASPYGQNTLKLEYVDADGVGSANLRWLVGMMFCFFWGAPIMYVILNVRFESFEFSSIPLYLYILAAFCFVAPIILRVYFNARHKKQMAVYDDYKLKGIHTVGKVVNVSYYVTGSGKSRTVHYYLNIEYERPDNGEKCAFKTPVLAKNPYLSKEDMPLRVNMYLYEDKVYADEIINPPLEKILARKKKQAFLGAVMMLGLLAATTCYCFRWVIPMCIFAVIAVAAIIMADNEK